MNREKTLNLNKSPALLLNGIRFTCVLSPQYPLTLPSFSTTQCIAESELSGFDHIDQ
ncbi:MAG: hypothetical protein P8103_03845 [Candidatus Thiodiazotropha sp.]